MPTLQIRMSEELFARIRLLGGSSWARAELEARAGLEGESASSSPPSEPVLVAPAPAPSVNPAVQSSSECSRAHFHRKGVFCKLCGEMG